MAVRPASRLSLATCLVLALFRVAAAQDSGNYPGAIVISSPLSVDRSSVAIGQTLTGTVTYSNNSGFSVSISAITIAARAPGATHTGGPFTDLTPSQPSTTIPPGGSVTLTAFHSFGTTDTLGRWEAYATYRDDTGAWHDGPSVFFNVANPGCVDGGDPAACGSLTISSALSIDRASFLPGQTLTGSVSYTNTSSSPVSVRAITIAARAPGTTHTGGPYSDLSPSQAATTIPAGGSVTLTATRAFGSYDAVGRWETYPTYQDGTGVWHDGPSLYIYVSAGACAQESDPAFCARLARACGVVSDADNCLMTRTVQSCGQCDQGLTCNSSNQCIAVSPTPTPTPTPSASMKIGTNFWYHTPNENNWSGETSMKSGIDWANAYGSGTNGLAATNIWDDTFVSELAPYTTVRFMDWGNTNFSKITSWSQRMLPTDSNNSWVYIDASSPANNPGMAYEWMIDLGNRTHKDIWICVPAQADPDYWTQLANLINSKLQPDRKVYIEYSNETWNGSFDQMQYTVDQGTAQGLPGSNQSYQGQSFALWQSLKMFKAFQDVFGASATGTRVIRVFAYGGNMDAGRQALRSVYGSAAWNPNNQKIDMLAIAPYVGRGLDGAASDVQSAFHHSIEEQETREDGGDVGRIAFAVQDLRTYGIPRLGAYEGGQSLWTNAATWSSNPQIYDEYMYMLDRWSKYFALFVHYTHTGKWTNGSAWGTKDHTGQPLSEAHKYRALSNWVSAHP